MSKEILRLRMFAGPNGSGKSTIQSMIRPELIGVYVNPDEIEKEIQELTFFDFHAYKLTVSEKEVLAFFASSSLLKKAGMLDAVRSLRLLDNKLIFHSLPVNAYFASALADFIRNKLIENKKGFTFETVMSFPDKIELLHKAQMKGYRTYLYYVATEDPSINVARINHRVKMGGHAVPEDKVIGRYERSLELLMQAVQSTNRSYIFDNSSDQPLWLAEVTDGKTLEMKTDRVPAWFKKAFLDKFQG